MNVIDTLEATAALEKAGFERGQAEAIVRVIQNAVTTEAATKADLENLETRVNTKIDNLQIKVEGYRSEVKNYVSKVEDYRAELQCYRAELQGYREELQGYREELQDYREETRSYQKDSQSHQLLIDSKMEAYYLKTRDLILSTLWTALIVLTATGIGIFLKLMNFF